MKNRSSGEPLPSAFHLLQSTGSSHGLLSRPSVHKQVYLHPMSHKSSLLKKIQKTDQIDSCFQRDHLVPKCAHISF